MKPFTYQRNLFEALYIIAVSHATRNNFRGLILRLLKVILGLKLFLKMLHFIEKFYILDKKGNPVLNYYRSDFMDFCQNARTIKFPLMNSTDFFV